VPVLENVGLTQASMPINSSCTFAVKCNSYLRDNFLRTTTSPRGLSLTK
jgi:hypothetical protein